MEVLTFLQAQEVKEIAKKQKEVNRQKSKAGYNLFTISSYTALLENFHSDVIASLLDPEGLHQERYKFLHLFIDYLRQCHHISIRKEDYCNSVVLRERGRIDIWIKDETSRQSIIIENKINDANDREDQLKDYWIYAVDNGYSVDAIIYLSKDGRKFAPNNGDLVNKIILNIAAYDNTPKDLHTGWLTTCHGIASNYDSSSLIYQYKKLLLHMGNTTLNDGIKESFYEFISDNEAFETVKAVNELIVFLPDYRAERFSKRTPSYYPFRRKRLYHNNYYLFEDFRYGEDIYKLDVFFQSDGNAYIVLWNTEKRDGRGYNCVKELLTKIGLDVQFNAPSMYHGMAAMFAISPAYPSLKAVDDAVLELVNEVFKKLTILSQQPE